MKPSSEPSFSLKVPSGEDRERRICDTCGFIDYVNPRIIVGAVVVHAVEGAPFGPDAVPLDQVKFLLCRRAIMPRRGYWTLPAGFMETDETVAEATRREAKEEACADLELDALLAIYDVPHLSEVQIMHRARLRTAGFAAGPESEAVALFGWDEIPWRELAFYSVSWALQAFRESRMEAVFTPYRNAGETGWSLPEGL